MLRSPGLGAARTLLCFCLATLMTGCSATTESGSRDVTPVEADYYVDAGAVRVAIRVGFPVTRTVTQARFLWDGHTDEVALYPDDGTDPDVAPDCCSATRARPMSRSSPRPTPTATPRGRRPRQPSPVEASRR
jgi:hypothetical protein